MLEYYLGGVTFMAKTPPQNDLLEVKITARRHTHNRRGSLD